MTTTEALETLRMLFGDPMAVFSSLLRSMITAAPGKKLYAGDYAAIEVRVLFWMAGHADGVAAYRDDRPIYEEMAAAIYDVPLAEIVNPSIERDMGKRAILGAGFQMGAPRFKDQCAEFGNIITEELAETAIKAYRRKHAPVVKMWANVERAAMAAVKNPGRAYKVNKTKWWVEGKYLFCELPSGRRNSYYGPEIRQRKMSWGEMREGLYHWGVDPIKKTWRLEATYGGKLVENCVQGTARDLMAYAMPRVEAEGYEIVLTVHDELVTEKAQGSAAEFGALMAELPPWAEGLPVKVGAYESPVYKK